MQISIRNAQAKYCQVRAFTFVVASRFRVSAQRRGGHLTAPFVPRSAPSWNEEPHTGLGFRALLFRGLGLRVWA